MGDLKPRKVASEIIWPLVNKNHSMLIIHKKPTEIHQNYSSSASNSASRSLTGTAAAQPLLPEAGRQPRLSPSPSAPVLNTKSHFRTSSDTTKIGRWWRQIFELTHCSKLELSMEEKSFWLRQFLGVFEGMKSEEQSGSLAKVRKCLWWFIWLF